MNFSSELVVSTDRRFLSRDPASAELLAIVGVDPKWAEYIRVLDRQGNLALLHYINTTVEAGGALNEEPLKEIGSVRGVIVDTDTGKVVCRSFEYTPEVVSTDVDRLMNLDLGSKRFYPACEGTVIRLYHYGGEWRIATHRKINAERSYWAGPTFGELFSKLRKFDYNILNTENCYIFLLSDNSNRLVYKVPELGQLMLLAVYNRATDSFLPNEDWGTPLEGVVYPEEVKINDNQQLQNVTNNYAQMQSFDRAGVMVVDPQNPSRPVKVINGDYNTIRNSRGNEPNLRARYLQVRGTPECDTLKTWFTDSEYQGVFAAAEAEIDVLVKVLHQMYIHRYVKKNFDTLPKEEFVVLQRCHTWHSEDRQVNIVTREKMREFVDTTPGFYLLTMLNRKRRAERAKQRLATNPNTDIPTPTPTNLVNDNESQNDSPMQS